MKTVINDVLNSLGDLMNAHIGESTPVLTAYIGVDTTDPDNQRDRPAWLIELKNEAKRIDDQHGTDALKRRDVQRKWSNTEEMIMAHLQERKPQGRSTVIFTDHESFHTVDLPVPLPTQLFYGTPHVKPLLVALDRYRKCLVALFSEEETKLVDVYLTVATGQTQIETGSAGGISLRPGGRKARTQASGRRDLDTKRSMVAEKAAEIQEQILNDPEIEHVIFGGNLKLAHAVKNALNPAIYGALVTVEPIAFASSADDIAAVAKRIAEEKVIEHDMALLNELVARRHACGTAVLETQGVMLALNEGRASKIVLSVPIDSDKFDQIMIQSVINGCEIDFLHGEAAQKLNEFGGIAAVLYYA